jgi:hypothetical protein
MNSKIASLLTIVLLSPNPSMAMRRGMSMLGRLRPAPARLFSTAETPDTNPYPWSCRVMVRKDKSGPYGDIICTIGNEEEAGPGLHATLRALAFHKAEMLRADKLGNREKAALHGAIASKCSTAALLYASNRELK